MLYKDAKYKSEKFNKYISPLQQQDEQAEASLKIKVKNEKGKIYD